MYRFSIDWVSETFLIANSNLNLSIITTYMLISDSHSDFLTGIENSVDRKLYIDKICQQGVTNICCAVFTTEKGISTDDIENYAKELHILSAKFNINLILSIEDCGFIQNDKELNQIINLKPLSVGLTWNYSNQFGGGAYTQEGLTELGEKTVRLLESKNILIDTAHLSKKAFWDFCKISQKPIYNSHSNIYNLRHHQRNLTNEQVEEIVRTDGFLGLTLYDNFIANKEISSRDIALQFDYLIKRFGINNFGFGTDFYGIAPSNLPVDVSQYADMVNISNELQKLGYDSDSIDKLMYKNFNEFLLRIGYKKIP